MKRVRFHIPATDTQGQCTIVGVSSLSETAYQNALWAYNDMRRHDGQRPVNRLPVDTTSEPVDDSITISRRFPK